MTPSGLPIDAAIPDVLAALGEHPTLVVAAPPGSGKTTVLPLALLDAFPGRIALLEPRRIAARAAARRMAQTLEERVGDTVGLRVRLETKVGPRTRIEVMTEGVLVRALLDDPELAAFDTVLFDEFHERSLDVDLAVALALDARALRRDLRLVAMSATLDVERIAALMEARIVRAEGRSFPVSLEHRDRLPREPVEEAVARAVRSALAEHGGSVLAFLPGQREIERTAERLGGVPASVHPLYGALPPAAQDRAIRPAAAGERKVVLATSIAETSLTIDGVSVVVDSGLSRRPRHDPASGLTRLETVRVSRAAAEQRAGRAGRTAPGHAIRLWREEQTGALEPFDPPEMLQADLSGLVLSLADWGVCEPDALLWLDPPPRAAWDEAKALLERLGALRDGALTPHGRLLARRPFAPRLAHVVVCAPDPVRAAELVLLLGERGLGGDGIDLGERLERFGRDRSPRAQGVRKLATRAAEGLNRIGTESVGATLARGFPDRIAQRGGAVDGRQRFRLSNGRGAELDAAHPLAREPFLVVADVGGREGRIFAAAAISREEVEAIAQGELETVREVRFEPQRNRAVAHERLRLGALVLAERRVVPEADEGPAAILEGLRRHGLALLPWPRERERLAFLDPSAADDAVLLETLDDWLGPFLVSDRVEPEQLADALLARSGHDRASLARALPGSIELASGERRALTYADGHIELHVRPQELFGTDRHPQVAGRPVRLVLLSPAGRPIQTTDDLPGFWRGSWSDVAKDMRGRYPRHPWPDEPWTAAPTSRAKPRRR